METADELDDLVNAAVIGAFGRPVIYVPSGLPPVTLDAYFAPRMGDLSPSAPAYESAEPRLEIRALALESAGITPAAGDYVTFDVRGTSRTYRVSQTLRNDLGMVEFQLSGRL